MPYIDIFRDTVICGKDEVSPNRFAGVDGTVGATKDYGVTIFGGMPNKAMEVIVLGIASVEVANGETIKPGDRVSPDLNGKAIADADGKFLAKTGGIAGNIIDVLLR